MLLHLESFDGGGTTLGDAGYGEMIAYLQARYPSTSLGSDNNRVVTQNGWGSGFALSWGRETSTQNNYIDFPTGSQTEIRIGFAVKPKQTVTTSTETLIRFRDATNNNVELRIFQGSTIQFYRNNAILTGVIAPNVLHQNRWSYVEVRVVFDNSTGIIECRINGQEVINATGLDTLEGSSTDINTVRFAGGTGNGFGNTDAAEQWLIDDIYVDTTTFHGPIKIDALFPTAEAGTIDFTPSTGSDNSALVDENPRNDDTDYNSSADTPGNKDLFVASNMSVVVDGIIGVQITNDAKLDAAGSIGLQSIVFNGSTQGTGNVVEVSSTSEYVAVKHIFEVNPDTAVAWTGSEVNNTDIGYEID
jgi:hypothetical protein